MSGNSASHDTTLSPLSSIDKAILILKQEEFPLSEDEGDIDEMYRFLSDSSAPTVCLPTLPEPRRRLGTDTFNQRLATCRESVTEDVMEAESSDECQILPYLPKSSPKDSSSNVKKMGTKFKFQIGRRATVLLGLGVLIFSCILAGFCLGWNGVTGQDDLSRGCDKTEAETSSSPETSTELSVASNATSQAPNVEGKSESFIYTEALERYYQRKHGECLQKIGLLEEELSTLRQKTSEHLNRKTEILRQLSTEITRFRGNHVSLKISSILNFLIIICGILFGGSLIFIFRHFRLN